MAEKYKCAVSVALVKDDAAKGFKAAVAGGVIDVAPDVTDMSGTPTKTSDDFVWGSVTKVLTGSSILRLVTKGAIKLDDYAAQYIDPFMKAMKEKNPAQNFSSMADLFGPESAKVKIIDMLGMRSGIPDFDTATPSRHPTDSFRKTVYEHPTKDYTPADMLDLPWVHKGEILFPPGTCDREKYYNCYSSTNFVLLGMVLAQHEGVHNWDQLNQNVSLADVLKDFATPLRYAMHGPPKKWTNVIGYDTTHYNGNDHPIDVSAVSGVFAGWTASDLVADAGDIARLVYDVYAPPYKLVSQKYVEMMYDRSTETGYGLATFNLTHRTGLHGPDGVAMGHLGATYGYQSIVAYNPAMDFSLAVATNIERDGQDQPADVMCSVYNAVHAIVRGLPQPTCRFSHGYWGGGCRCE